MIFRQPQIPHEIDGCAFGDRSDLDGALLREDPRQPPVQRASEEAHFLRQIIGVLDDLAIHVRDIERAVAPAHREDRTEIVVA